MDTLHPTCMSTDNNGTHKNRQLRYGNTILRSNTRFQTVVSYLKELESQLAKEEWHAGIHTGHQTVP